MAEEARLRPDYAATLGRGVPEWQARRQDAELRLADRIVVLSTFQRAGFVEEGIDEDRLVVVPLGVDLDVFRPRARQDNGSFRVLFVGQITQSKGISYLVDAFAKAKIPASELQFVGGVVGTNGPWRRLQGVTHVPHVPRYELPPYYGRADVYVLPSLFEGFALTAIEAMAAGLPVIVSEHTFGADVITDGVDGFVVPIRDSDAIAERLRFLHASPTARARIGAAARRRAEDYSWERYGRRIVAALTGREEEVERVAVAQ
jgi:glycosyltransferase involved in cell wall biosynthesis